jgi:hypothetical protein
MISKESLVLIAVLVILVISFMTWSQSQSTGMQDSVNQSINDVLKI